ncbi:MAG: class I poly(R)-hydroxyalkanoic acid synthase [Proteobacteria bacterium]|nr:class I poly(R)-hydroxyalkanoic acid synthase [Pseudomonadota bacterium]
MSIRRNGSKPRGRTSDAVVETAPDLPAARNALPDDQARIATKARSVNPAPAQRAKVTDKAPSRSAKAPPPREAASSQAGGSTQKEQIAFAHPVAEIEALAENSAELMEQASKASVAMLSALQDGEKSARAAEDGAEIARAFGSVAEYWAKDPARYVEAQQALSFDMMNLWGAMLRQASGEKVEPAPTTPARDSRFTDPEWTENPYFNFLRQAYFAGTRWAEGLVEKAEGIDTPTRRKANFYLRQLAGALSPSNFVATNPELLRQTIEERGENLTRGMKMLAEDVEAGGGELRIRQTDPSGFEVGRNLANTPGKVVFRNELFELIHYTPTTESVFRTPLLIVPPWINKFYILDLNPEKSFIRWAVSEGLSVFVISWVNPDRKLRKYDFEAYMKKGILEAIEQVEKATGEKSVDTIGYCVGGTLLSVTLAYIAQGKRPERIRKATLFTTQVDFTHAGDLLAFVDEGQIQAVEKEMAKHGYLPGAKMAGAFNMLRPNDLIWSYMVNNYLKGKQPAPFDLLYWNSDSTRMPEANHSFYLRNCYLHNRLAKGEMVIGERKLDLGKVKQPIYNLAAKEDHIAPAKSVFVGSGLFGGEVTYVMAGSGHIAGVVNPAGKPKYQFWTGGAPKGAFEDWATKAVEHPGSWWPHWLAWLTQGEKRVAARHPGDGKLKPLCDAPGTYVLIKS